jgi:hypothetical protein
MPATRKAVGPSIAGTTSDLGTPLSSTLGCAVSRAPFEREDSARIATTTPSGLSGTPTLVFLMPIVVVGGHLASYQGRRGAE